MRKCRARASLVHGSLGRKPGTPERLVVWVFLELGYAIVERILGRLWPEDVERGVAGSVASNAIVLGCPVAGCRGRTEEFLGRSAEENSRGLGELRGIHFEGSQRAILDWPSSSNTRCAEQRACNSYTLTESRPHRCSELNLNKNP